MPQEFPAIRLVALDLDGTLLNREGHVTPRTRAALQAAVDKGVYIVPATGRPLASLPPEVAQLPGIRYVITCNGAAVWDLGNDPMGAVYSRYSNAKEHRTSTPVCLLHSLMPVETAREAFAVCESCHADLRIFSDGYACTDAHSIALAAARAAKKDGTEARQPNDGRFTILRDAAEWMSRNAFAIEKLCVFFETPQQAAAALPRFRAVPGVEIVQGSPRNVEVTAAGVDTLDQTIQMVLSGRADATLNAEVSFYDYMSVHPDANLKVVALTEEASKVSLPMRKEERCASLLEAVNQAIAELDAEGELTRISEKYFGKDITRLEQ
jgi:hydroxymethylpyrimidine pyrophosphatase-like HAD family hydrolase